jgi:glycosyltransferase involved in cell wall biosynthesis
MFPNHVVSRYSQPQEAQALSTYQLMLSNSSFTKTYADGFWEYPRDRSHVLTPPIGQSFIQSARERLGSPLLKDKQFIHVGRFNPGNHNKNQLVIIESFLSARKKFANLSDWKLVLVGNVNQTPDALRYFEACKKLEREAEGRVTILNDLPQQELLKWLGQSFGYVHGTGAFIPPGSDPEKCEHFGLSIIEAMAFGCIPLVYARGGIFDVLEPGVSGIPYIDRDGLEKGMSEIAGLWGTGEGYMIQQAAIKGASVQGQEHFTAKLAQFLQLALQ